MNLIILVFVGGAFGAMWREFLILLIPRLSDGFPLNIFVANMLASFLLGWSAESYRRTALHQYVHVMVGTGIMGGMSTFSSFVHGAVDLLDRPDEIPVVLTYVLGSLLLGFIAVATGMKVARVTTPTPTDRA